MSESGDYGNVFPLATTGAVIRFFAVDRACRVFIYRPIVREIVTENIKI